MEWLFGKKKTPAGAAGRCSGTSSLYCERLDEFTSRRFALASA
jgi:hypothetical protein